MIRANSTEGKRRLPDVQMITAGTPDKKLPLLKVEKKTILVGNGSSDI